MDNRPNDGASAGARAGDGAVLVAAGDAGGGLLLRLARAFLDREEPPSDLHLPPMEPRRGLSHVVAVADRAAGGRFAGA
jgi:hypothetical protein